MIATVIIFVIIFLGLGIANFIFAILALIQGIKNNSTLKIVLAILGFFVCFMGFIAYFVKTKPNTLNANTTTVVHQHHYYTDNNPNLNQNLNQSNQNSNHFDLNNHNNFNEHK